jgi:hypothetical protein
LLSPVPSLSWQSSDPMLPPPPSHEGSNAADPDINMDIEHANSDQDFQELDQSVTWRDQHVPDPPFHGVTHIYHPKLNGKSSFLSTSLNMY